MMNARHLLFAPVLLGAAAALHAQDFTWIAGDGTSDGAATYTPPGEEPGGRRRGGGWLDATGNVWLFGGELNGSGDFGNDLWKFDPLAGQWEFVNGSATPNSSGNYGTQGTGTATTVPSARQYQETFVGDDGRLWMFGGATSSGIFLDDLWVYDPGTDIWTWVDGNSTPGIYFGSYGVTPSPGGISNAASAADSSGRLLVFGGRGNGNFQSGHLNDLWRYDPDTSTWELLSGSGNANQAGSYGTVGTPGGFPGGRLGSALWTDSSDRIYLFGGDGYDSAGVRDRLNDLWRFDPGTSQWTWLGGSDLSDQLGTYGTQGLPDAANWPGARRTPATGKDLQGRFLMFGGFGFNHVTSGGLSDFWRYDPATGLWEWVALTRNTNVPPVIGTLGVQSPCNQIEARSDSYNFASNGSRRYYVYGSAFSGVGNDVLWEYVTPDSEVDSVTLSDADGANSPDAGFTNDPVITVDIAFTGGTPTYARLSESNCLTPDETPALPSPVSFTLSSGDGLKTVYARVGDAEAQSRSVAATITLDTTAPVVTVDTLSTTDSAPELTGTITEANLREVTVTVEGQTYTADVTGGTWSLAAGTISPTLATGTYDVTATATDQAGNVASDATNGELEITNSGVPGWQIF